MFVRNKLPLTKVPKEVLVPLEVRGVPTDVVEVGRIAVPLPLQPPLGLTLKEPMKEIVFHLLIAGLQGASERLMEMKENIKVLTFSELDVRNVLWVSKPNIPKCSQKRAKFLPRPVPCGVSVGHPQITAGTLGCLVRNAKGQLFILSNNHVLSNSNSAQLGEPILQPAPSDGGKNTQNFTSAG